jgi:hypothetical protein
MVQQNSPCWSIVPGRGRKKERFSGLRNFGRRVRSARLPSPGTVADAYLGSEFHQKNFKQPLVSRARQEDDEVARERQRLVQGSSPGELAKLSSPFDIPLPKFRSKSKSRKTNDAKEEQL